MNKQTRRYREYLKYKNRIERFLANGGYVYLKSEKPARFGIRVDKPSVHDIMNDGGWSYYKDTSTPCSCPMCSHDKYKRVDFKKETRRLIDEYQIQ